MEHFQPGVELSPVDRVEILYDYMEDFNPGVEILYVPAIRSNKKVGNFKRGCRKYETYLNVFFLAEAGLKFQPWG